MSRSAKIFILITVPLLLLSWLSYVVDKGLGKIHNPYSSLNDIYNGEANSDMLICGSSRAEVHISPAILDSALHKNSFNIGISGWGFHMQHAIFNIYLQHNKKPEYLLQVVDLGLFTDREDFYDYQYFLPYANDSIVIEATKNYIGKFTFPELYFPLFKYNNNMALVKLGVLSYFGYYKDNIVERNRGFHAKKWKWRSSVKKIKKLKPDGFEVAQELRLKEEFEQFLVQCKKEGIKVILVYTPTYFEYLHMVQNIDDIRGLFQGFAEKYNIPYLDYTHDLICYKKEYFYSFRHLNKTGAEIFSRKLANDLRPYIEAQQ